MTSALEVTESLSKSSSSHICRHCGLPVRTRKNKSPEFCCYGCSFAYQVVGAKDSSDKPVNWIMVKLGISAFFAMNVMGFSLALHSSSIYPDFFSHISTMGKAMDEMMRYLLLFLSAPVLFLLGAPLFENIIHEALNRRWSVDGFIGLGVAASFVYSLISTFRSSGPLYYDVAVMVLVFLTLGRYLEARFRFQTTQSLKELFREEKKPVIRVEKAREVIVRPEILEIGDEILVRAGSKIPVDGVVTAGDGLVETSSLDGEIIPSIKKKDNPIIAGMTLVEGYLKIRVTQKESESWLHRLEQTIEEAKQSKAPIEKLADNLAILFTWISVLAAVLGFALGWVHGGIQSAILRGLSVLVISCPCALGVATPLAFWKVYELITRHGILFKDLSRLETLSKARGVFFDKTGTLTESGLAFNFIRRWTPESENEIIRISGSLALASDHPLSKALVKEALVRNIKLAMPERVSTKTGEGMSGILADAGTVFIGNIRYFEAHGIACTWNELALLKRYTKEGEPHLLVGWGGKLRALISFKENLRLHAENVLKQLLDDHLEVGILTGAGGESASYYFYSLPIEVVKGLSPENKMDWIANWESRHGPALVVGEGLNDAPLLSRASVSLAMGSGLDRTRAVADFVLQDDDLRKIPWLIEIARKTMSKIQRNLFWALIYNSVAIPLAVLGIVNPMIAGAAMVLSSFFVITNSLSVAGKR